MKFGGRGETQEMTDIHSSVHEECVMGCTSVV